MTEEEILRGIRSELDETETPPTPFVTADRLVDIGRRRILEGGCDNRDMIIAAVMRAYDQYVRPFDLPGVPNFIEEFVDRMIGTALEQGLRGLANAICED